MPALRVALGAMGSTEDGCANAVEARRTETLTRRGVRAPAGARRAELGTTLTMQQPPPSNKTDHHMTPRRRALMRRLVSSATAGSR